MENFEAFGEKDAREITAFGDNAELAIEANGSEAAENEDIIEAVNQTKAVKHLDGWEVLIPMKIPGLGNTLGKQGMDVFC
jgi:hypothetical protein